MIGIVANCRPYVARLYHRQCQCPRERAYDGPYWVSTNGVSGRRYGLSLSWSGALVASLVAVATWHAGGVPLTSLVEENGWIFTPCWASSYSSPCLPHPSYQEHISHQANAIFLSKGFEKNTHTRQRFEWRTRNTSSAERPQEWSYLKPRLH